MLSYADPPVEVPFSDSDGYRTPNGALRLRARSQSISGLPVGPLAS